MVKSIAARRAKTRKGRKVLMEREPKVEENPKCVAVVRGHATSTTVNKLLTELHMLQRPLSKRFSRKNVIRPFEPAGEAPLESILVKADCSLFLLGNHTKKRPDNLIVGRLFDGHLLDMVEFGVEGFTSMDSFEVKKPSPGASPCIVFKGDFQQSDVLSKTKNLLLDFFRGKDMKEIDLAGLERLVSVELSEDGKLRFKNHRILLKKSGGKLPKVELEEMGPSFTLNFRRTHFASPDLMKEALRKPRGTAPKKVKNVSYDNGLGDKLGRVHVSRQNLDELALRKMKGLKRARQLDAYSVQNSEEPMPENGDGIASGEDGQGDSDESN
mmetsp:Transcript_10959/g.33618  ORF Transcript_10959/g.33618 Transcript_10959/m.33618 type:complete len:327 (+) Transcript_10959:86-1066(+)